MKALLVTIIIALLCAYLREEPVLLTNTNTTDRIHFAGYGSETHNIYTKDGYGLTIFRIKNATRPDDTTPAPVVLFMHGLGSSSDSFVIRGLKNALAFELVEKGYDVWLGNARGNTYGKRHLSMSPRDGEFWRFSWHEIGLIDLPTIMDYVLAETRQSALHYVGHSQGTTIMFVLLSTRPEYNAKLKTAHMMAPIVYMSQAQSPILYLTKYFLGTHTPLNSLLGDVPFMHKWIVRKILGFERCRSLLANQKFCQFVFFLIYGGYSDYFNTSLTPEVFECHPSTASGHQAFHLVQLHFSGRFCQYDLGAEGNLQRYNSSSPPDYAVSNINPRFPLHLYYSDYDKFASKTDVEKCSRILGNRSVNHFIDLKNFAHIAFIWGSNIKDVINPVVLKTMNEAEELLHQSDPDKL